MSKAVSYGRTILDRKTRIYWDQERFQLNYESLDFSSWLGRREHLEDLISPSPARAAAGLFDYGMIGTREEMELPPMWHWFYFWSQALQRDLGPEGHEKLGSFLPKVPLPRRMYAGGSCEFIEPLVVGAVASKESTVVDVKFKNGSSGPLFFVTVEHRITQLGIVRCVETQNLVYREEVPKISRPDGISLGPSRENPGRISFAAVELPCHEKEWSRSGSIVAETPLLFRFSALTYNAHKIHYDPIWTIGEEGYSQLVVHGPLVAISLLELLRNGVEWPSVRSFEFRAHSPAVLGDEVSLKAIKEIDSDKVELVATVGDRIIMTARALLLF